MLIEVPNPDNELDVPIFYGSLAGAHEALVTGDYAARQITDGDDVPGRLVVFPARAIFVPDSV
jgi:hypothetical protein